MGKKKKRKARLTLPVVVSFSSPTFFPSFLLFFSLPRLLFLFFFSKTTIPVFTCGNELPVVPWHSETHTLQPLRHRQPRSCARYPISGRYFYSQILRSLVACLVMSAYTRSVNTGARACIHTHTHIHIHIPPWTERACNGVSVCQLPFDVSRHTWTKHHGRPCGRRSDVCDRVLYTCHRTDRWTPCRFHFHPYHADPGAGGKAVGMERFRYFFSPPPSIFSLFFFFLFFFFFFFLLSFYRSFGLRFFLRSFR